jgi:hypothetical protein
MTLVALLPWPSDRPAQVWPRYESLTFADPAISYALQNADDRGRWAAASAAVHTVAAAAGMAEDPVLRAAAGRSAGVNERTALDQMARELKPRNRWPQFRAVEAARAALGPDALAAAFAAITEAGYGIQATGADTAALWRAVMAALGDPPPPAGSMSLSPVAGVQPWDPYTWTDQHWIGWAAELTFVHGPAAAGRSSTDGAAVSRGPVILQTGLTWSLHVGDWSLMLNVGEVHRPRQPYVEALSVGGEAVHLSWSSRGQAHFWHAVDGDLRAAFNVYQPNLVSGSAPSELDALRAGLTFPLAGLDGGRQAPMLLALAQRITGVGFTPEILDAAWEARTSAR